MDLKIRAVFFCVLIHAVKRIRQESIADSVGVPQPTIINIINNIKKRQLSEIGKTLKTFS